MEKQRGASERGGGEGMEKAKTAAREVTSAAAEAAAKRAEGFFETNKAATVSGLGAVANALRSAASDMEGGLSGAARRAADVMEQATHALEQRDLDHLLAEAQDYARRQPAVFLGGAFAAGFALARLLKASSERTGGGGFGGGERFGQRFDEGQGYAGAQGYSGGAQSYGREPGFGGEQGYPGGGQEYGGQPGAGSYGGSSQGVGSAGYGGAEAGSRGYGGSEASSSEASRRTP